MIDICSKHECGAECKSGQIYEKMVSVMADIGHVSKDGVNQGQGYKFRSIMGVYKAAQTAMVQHGVFCLPKVIDSATEERTGANGKTTITRLLTVEYRFVAGDGSYVVCVAKGEGTDTSDKATNKAMAAAHKYAITQTFVIPYEGMEDGDRETVEHPERARKMPVRTPASAPADLKVDTAVDAEPDHKANVKMLMARLDINLQEITKIAWSLHAKPLSACTNAEFKVIADHLIEMEAALVPEDK